MSLYRPCIKGFTRLSLLESRNLSVVNSTLSKSCLRHRRHMSILSPSDNVSIKVTDENIAILHLSNGPANVLSETVLTDMTKAIQTLEDAAPSFNLKDPIEDAGVRGIVLISSIPGVFSAGLDLNILYQPKREILIPYIKTFWKTCLTLGTTKLPVVTAIQGVGMAAGTVFALLADYRLAAPHPKFSMGLSEVNVGFPPPYFIHKLASDVLGSRIAHRHLQLGEIITSPEKALSMGLVDEIVDGAELVNRGVEVIRSYGKVPWRGRGEVKRKDRAWMNELNGDDIAEEVWKWISEREGQLVLQNLIASLRSKKQ